MGVVQPVGCVATGVEAHASKGTARQAISQTTPSKVTVNTKPGHRQQWLWQEEGLVGTDVAVNGMCAQGQCDYKHATVRMLQD